MLAGTFSLAMAFAGNDLVNFIGVPLAGLESYRHFAGDPSFSPDTLLMTSLSEPVKTPTIFLLIAGLLMVATLFLSKKARTISMTEINLAKQGSGSERFSSSRLYQIGCQAYCRVLKFISRIVPDRVTDFIEKEVRFSFLQKTVQKPRRCIIL
ncbi:MAG: hypothetical protein U5L72_03300 [Bacteroidales bacterium]|nr:hypothetical protein [Bacteroidales bacterium]